MSEATHRNLLALPKAHLHLHATGSIRPATLVELADRVGLRPPTFTGRYATWAEFLAAYRSIKPVLARPEDLHRVLVELFEDDAVGGAVWTEVSISPTGGHRALTGSDDAVLELATDALAVATGSGATGGIVVAADRGRDAGNPEAVARLAVDWADRGVVGFGLAGDETLSARPFARAAAIVRDAGLLVAPHAGETLGPASVREALEVLRPDRLMHGVRAVEDPALVAELADRGVVLDVCASSNVALGVVPDLARHPLPSLLRAGVRCSLNADDTLVFATDLATEYRRARHALGLDDADLAVVARTSLEASAAPAAIVDATLADIDAWLTSPPGPGVATSYHRRAHPSS